MHTTSHVIDQISSLGTIVTVWAHPDDETYLAGGLMSLARHLGHAVTCVTATDGDFAADESERGHIGRLRSKELTAALGALGVVDSERLGMRDGACDQVPERVGIDRIAAIIADRRPDTIVTFGPDGLTGHPDHRAVARWTAAAARIARPDARVLVPMITPATAAEDRDINDRFAVFEPGLPTLLDPDAAELDLRIDAAWLDTKYLALSAHHSQTAGIIEALGETRYRRWISREPYVDLARWSARRLLGVESVPS